MAVWRRPICPARTPGGPLKISLIQVLLIIGLDLIYLFLEPGAHFAFAEALFAVLAEFEASKPFDSSHTHSEGLHLANADRNAEGCADCCAEGNAYCNAYCNEFINADINAYCCAFLMP